MLKISLFCVLLAFCLSCSPARKAVSKDGSAESRDIPGERTRADSHGTLTDPVMESLLAAYPQYFKDILAKRRELKVQVIYTQIDRLQDNSPVFRPYYFNVNPADYFYPASTVKLPIAALGLEKLNELGIAALDKFSPMLTLAEGAGQTAVLNDPSSRDGSPSLATYIKKILLVSDNDAFNRIYEFLGQEYLHQKLSEKGYANAQVVHRLAVSLPEEQNRKTNPVIFLDSAGSQAYIQPGQSSNMAYAHRKDSVGRGFISGQQLVHQAMDFSARNRFTLPELDKVLKTILFPASFPEKERFRLNPGDYAFLHRYMSQYPAESDFPAYDPAGFYDSYVKFIYYGSERTAPTVPGIRIFNKVGNAYGFLTDLAYVVDFDRGVEFMVSATIYCNSDGILNDDQYDYESVGLPFLKQLGRVLYEMELKRERKYRPDLSAFRINYKN